MFMNSDKRIFVHFTAIKNNCDFELLSNMKRPIKIPSWDSGENRKIPTRTAGKLPKEEERCKNRLKSCEYITRERCSRRIQNKKS